MSKSNKAQATKVKATAPTTNTKLIETYGSKSAAIRALAAQGLDRSSIVKAFLADGEKMIYQHVNNVLSTKLKRPAATK